jgi:hypothetical protein
MKTFAQTRWNLLAAVTFLAFAPTRLDAGGNSQQSVDQRVDQLTRLISAIHAALDGVVFVLGHAVVVAAHIVVVACVATAVVWLLVKTAVPLTHRRMGQSRLASVRIVPPIEGAYNTASWVTFFQMLHAIAAPWWKRALFGQAWLVFELEAHEGHIIARCWFPTGTEKLVAAAIRSALPGANIMPTEDGLAPPRPQAARARLRLWREDLYPLEASQTDAIATAAEALAGAGDGLIQVAMAPDTGWEARAGKRLDQLSGFDSHESIFLKVLRLPLDFLFEFWFSYPEPASKPPSQRRAAAPLPPTDKAGQACWRVEVRLCCWAPRRSSAIGSLRPIVSAFQALDGENRLRVAKVWWPLGFDSALTKRLGPGHTSMVLSPAEAAQLFHLPLAGVPMDSARVRAMPRRLSLVAGDGSVLCRLDDDRRAAVKISQTDRRHHLHAVGPTGAGKSTLLLNLALQDIEAGIGVGVIDPKGDLIRDLLERIPTQHANRVILLDPSTRERPVGLNVLECDDPSQRELVTDGVVTIFRKNFERFWGPRTDDVLRAALLTLLRHPGATLTEVPLLLLNQRVRARLTKNLGDPVGLKPFWQEYEAQTEGPTTADGRPGSKQAADLLDAADRTQCPRPEPVDHRPARGDRRWRHLARQPRQGRARRGDEPPRGFFRDVAPLASRPRARKPPRSLAPGLQPLPRRVPQLSPLAPVHRRCARRGAVLSAQPDAGQPAPGSAARVHPTGGRLQRANAHRFPVRAG